MGSAFYLPVVPAMTTRAFEGLTGKLRQIRILAASSGSALCTNSRIEEIALVETDIINTQVDMVGTAARSNGENWSWARLATGR